MSLLENEILIITLNNNNYNDCIIRKLEINKILPVSTFLDYRALHHAKHGLFDINKNITNVKSSNNVFVINYHPNYQSDTNYI